MRWLLKRNTRVSVFVIVWIAVFHYETLRANYLSPFVGHPLPKLPFLYPPAGWIMFFNVGPPYGMAEVYGVRHGQRTLIDPHEIFRTRFVWYDDVRRNVLVSVLSADVGPSFCRYLYRKFPDFEQFLVVYAAYEHVVTQQEPQRYVAYQCR